MSLHSVALIYRILYTFIIRGQFNMKLKILAFNIDPVLF
jgi:hypothetical protein